MTHVEPKRSRPCLVLAACLVMPRVLQPQTLLNCHVTGDQSLQLVPLRLAYGKTSGKGKAATLFTLAPVLLGMCRNLTTITSS